ncbi:unnamed protein product [Arctogadus glacialis]
MVAPWWPHGGPMVAPWWPHGGPMVAPWWPHGGPMVALGPIDAFLCEGPPVGGSSAPWQRPGAPWVHAVGAPFREVCFGPSGVQEGHRDGTLNNQALELRRSQSKYF